MLLGPTKHFFRTNQCFLPPLPIVAPCRLVLSLFGFLSFYSLYRLYLPFLSASLIYFYCSSSQKYEKKRWDEMVSVPCFFSFFPPSLPPFYYCISTLLQSLSPYTEPIRAVFDEKGHLLGLYHPSDVFSSIPNKTLGVFTPILPFCVCSFLLLPFVAVLPPFLIFLQSPCLFICLLKSIKNSRVSVAFVHGKRKEEWFPHFYYTCLSLSNDLPLVWRAMHFVKNNFLIQRTLIHFVFIIRKKEASNRKGEKCCRCICILCLVVVMARSCSIILNREVNDNRLSVCLGPQRGLWRREEVGWSKRVVGWGRDAEILVVFYSKQ